MSEQNTSIDLSAFADEYDIVGEQDSPDESRIFVANRKSDDTRRRDDRTGVLITVHSTPAGDEANALTQYAADTGTLTNLAHRRLVPVLDGRWIGDDLFAVVTQRITDPTLAQKLALGDTFHSTRIAAILREVNGLLEWAREQKIVHRRVTPEQVYLEPNTDRVRVTFAISPISRLKQPGTHDDARTIARLAVAMLGGDPDIQACDQESLQSLRPGLPELFCKATAKLLDDRDTATQDDIAAFLSLISMADPLVEGESERDRIRAQVLEEQRVEREKLANERIEFDAKVAEERAAFEKQMADERAAFEKAKADERARVERERADMQKAAMKERDEMERVLEAERAALLARRDELEKKVAAQLAELQRAAEKDRAEIERLRVALRTAGDQEIEKKRLAALEDITGDEESVLDNEDLATPLFGMPRLAPIEPISFNTTPLHSNEPIVLPVEPIIDTPEERHLARGKAGAPWWTVRRNQLAAAGVVAFLAIGGAAAVMTNQDDFGRPATASRVATSPGEVSVRPASPLARELDQAASPRLASGASRTAAAPAPQPATFTVDSASARAWLDSLRAEHPVDMPWAMSLQQVQNARAERVRLAAEADVRAAQRAAAEERARAERRAIAEREAEARGVKVPEGILSQPGGVRASRPRAGQPTRDSATGADTAVNLPISPTPPPVTPPTTTNPPRR